MRQFDSRFTRVQPIFDEIQKQDNWLTSLLDLSFHNSNHKAPPASPIIEKYWGDSEKTIKSPDEYLLWMIANTNKLKDKSPDFGTSKDDDTRRLRKELFQRNKDIYRKARKSIKENTYDTWCILEGPTNYDLFIETEDFFYIAEGKRTENQRTSDTTWNSNRDQMIRNIDCLFSYNTQKPIYAFYILEEQDGILLNKWPLDIKYYTQKEHFKDSLPHRSEIEVDIIFESYIGHLTWQGLIEKFKIDKSIIPDRYEKANGE